MLEGRSQKYFTCQREPVSLSAQGLCVNALRLQVDLQGHQPSLLRVPAFLHRTLDLQGLA